MRPVYPAYLEHYSRGGSLSPTLTIAVLKDGRRLTPYEARIRGVSWIGWQLNTALKAHYGTSITSLIYPDNPLLKDVTKQNLFNGAHVALPRSFK